MQRLGLVRTWKESKLARGTYNLAGAEVGTDQGTERKQATTKGHLLPRKCGGQDWSGHRKKASLEGAPTNWREEARTGQDTERKQAWKGHLQTGGKML